MNIAIVVHGAGASSDAPRAALSFARAVVAGGHHIHRVFFYHDAVHVANSYAVTPQDETDISKRWAEFAAVHGIELAVCVAAALRRGVLNADEAERYDRAGANLLPPFQITGLGQLVEAAINADRLVTFAA
jgi:tRNA 2-thiouridine synthesizing protein D